MMADDQVLDESFEFGWEVRDQSDLLVQHFQLDNHVPEKLPFGGIGKRALIAELVDLSNIVQEGSGEQQVAIDLRIQGSDRVAKPHQRDHVLKQPADKGMVQRLCRRSQTI